MLMMGVDLGNICDVDSNGDLYRSVWGKLILGVALAYHQRWQCCSNIYSKYKSIQYLARPSEHVAHWGPYIIGCKDVIHDIT